MLLRHIRYRYGSPLTDALDWIRRRSVTGRDADWLALRRDAEALARRDPTPAGRYRALQMVLNAIGERHGAVLAPDDVPRFRRGAAVGFAHGLGLLAVHPDRIVVQVYPGGPAERAGVAAGDVVERVNGEPPVQLGRLPLLDLTDRAACLTLRRADRAPAELRLEPSTYSVTQIPSGGTLPHDVRCIAIPPATKSMAHPYLSAAHRVIRQFDRLPSSRWVVDLRLNLGGDLYLMLAAIAPVLGDGDVGGLVDARGRRQPWRCQDGNVYLGSRRRVRVDDPVRLNGGLPAVAVLTSRLTASAGEAVVAAFSGRPRTRRFGEPTAGLATGLDDKKLRDGGIVRCSTSLFSDRTGRAECGPLEPDAPVACDWRRLGGDGDPVLEAAVEWLRSLPADGSPAARE